MSKAIISCLFLFIFYISYSQHVGSFDLFDNATLDQDIKIDTTVSINKPSGFYSYLFQVIIESSTPGQPLKYTLDGSDPRSSKKSISGNSPIAITINPVSTSGNRGQTGAVVLRACEFQQGLNPNEPVTRTYIFLANVITQDAPGGNWPSTNINGQHIDLKMDPNITNDTRFKNLLNDALLDIPTLSIVTDAENLFNPDSGIYVNAKYHGDEWERAANVELINPDGSTGFSIDAGLRIRGGWSRHDDFAKHAFRLYFRTKYGSAKLDFPMFENEGVNKFDKIDLRTSQNYSWSKGGDEGKYNTMNRDVFSRDSQGAMKQPYTRSRYYHLYLNGLYWGIYQSQERAEAYFAQSYLGGNEADYDVIKVDIGENWDLYTIEATDGNTDAWFEIWKMCQKGFVSNTNYFNLLGLSPTGQPDTSMNVMVDVDNLIDYMLVIFYGGNFDSPVSKFSSNYNPNNFFAIYNRNKKREGFKFIIHDAEHTLLKDAVGPGSGLYENRVNIGSISYQKMEVTQFEKFQPQWLHFKLSQNAEYRMRFADHVYNHFFNNGVFIPDSAKARFKKTADQLNMAIIAESARWGDVWAWPARNKEDDWIPAVNQVVNDFIPYRTDIVLDQITNENLYVNLSPPVFKKGSTEIKSNIFPITEEIQVNLLSSNSNGAIFYTTDGVDPRMIGGSTYSKSTDAGKSKIISITKGTHLKARVKNGSDWSALHECYFSDVSVTNNLKVTELHYHPKDDGDISGKDIEFIELKNTASIPLNLSGISFTEGISFTFPEGTTINAGEFFVIASNFEVYTSYYGVSPSFAFTGNLSNSGEKITLSGQGQTIFSFTYSDKAPWPVEADGNGYSLVSYHSNPKGDPNNASYWTLSDKVNGSANSDDYSSATSTPEVLFVGIQEMNIYPNPAASDIHITFSLSTNQWVQGSIFDLNGKLLYAAFHENLPEGEYERTINLNNILDKAGVYFIRLQSEGKLENKKFIYLK